jgi:hypothetical protein
MYIIGVKIEQEKFTLLYICAIFSIKWDYLCRYFQHICTYISKRVSLTVVWEVVVANASRTWGCGFERCNAVTWCACLLYWLKKNYFQIWKKLKVCILGRRWAKYKKKYQKPPCFNLTGFEPTSFGTKG